MGVDLVETVAEAAEKIGRVSPVGPMKNDVDPERPPFGRPSARIDPMLGEDDRVADDDPRRAVIAVSIAEE
jgi:hypothetical protein